MEVKVGSVSEGSIVELVDGLIAKAVKLSASDIHLESCGDGLRVRYRVDGVLQDQPLINSQMGPRVVCRIKVLANLDLAQQRVPQDGKFQYFCDGNSTDLRISTFPGVHGEKVVIRILDQKHQDICLKSLGLNNQLLEKFKKLLKKPNGFILVTGPTGSGKTTTLYAALMELHAPDKNIITLEDPVEYDLDGITQGQIYPDNGFTFAKGIRSLLRQDPDIAMIGEIRDPESARIAIEAALTGHLVLSTLHTNDAPSAIVRLMDMGIEPFLLNASLTGVVAQRLVRKICEDCKFATEPSRQEGVVLKDLDIDMNLVFKGRGCDSCDGIGYKGRTAIFELLEVTDELRDLIIHDPKFMDIYQQAIADGMVTLKQSVIELLKNSTTSLDEVMRILA